jgi:crotonobetainyl-CoA:carnitine CoA-transferase CaiB-like acyl-CoA transferase
VASDSRSPLAGIKVLEIAQMWAGPLCGKYLADFGAVVDKIEEPNRGDPSRTMGPCKNGLSICYARANANKRSASIDIRLPEGQDLIRKLVANYDVVIENFRPGRMERWGLGYDALRGINPRLVMVRISGYGQVDGTGRSRDELGPAGFGTVGDAVSGFAHMNGWPHTPPTTAPFGLTDTVAAITATFGTAMALFARERTGLGEEIDLALYEPMMNVMSDPILRYTATGEEGSRRGNLTDAASPRGAFECQDEAWIVLAGSSQAPAMRLLDAIGRSDLRDDPRFATNDARVAHDDQLTSIIEQWVAALPQSKALAILEKFEVPCGPVNSPKDVAENEAFLARGSLVRLKVPELGSPLVPGALLRVASLPPHDYETVPHLGEHTDEILVDEIGLGSEQLQTLRMNRVIQ